MKKIIIPILIIAMFFCIIPKTEYATGIHKIGDISGDGVIDSRDTLKILEHIAASTISNINKLHPDWILKDNQLKAADINGDGVIDSRDTLRELEYIAASTIPKIGNTHPEWKKYIEEKWKIEATGIKLDKTNMTIYKGKTGRLSATVVPANTTNKIIKWSSSNTKVATVDGLGNVTGKSKGIAIITATTSNGKKATCTVTVKIPEAKTVAISSVTLKQIDRTIAVNTSLQLNAVVQPTNATNKTLTWSSSDNSIAKVDKNGVVKGIKPGKVTITVKTSNNKIATCIIRVNIPAKSISLNKTTITINKGTSVKLKAIFNPTNTSSKEINWKSSNPSIVSIESNKTTNGSVMITAKSKGKATITATHKYGLSTTCKVSVIEIANIENNKIEVNGRNITIGQYANFRNVCVGKIAPNILYRCINPILPYSKKEEKRAYYADRLLEIYHINTVLNLSDRIEDIKSKGYSKATYYKQLFDSENVYLYSFKDNGLYGTLNTKKTVVGILRGIINNKGPYAIHCKWGQGRTGFVIMLLECLMDAKYEYIYNDFIASFNNLNHKDSKKEFSKCFSYITGKKATDINNPKSSDWKNINFVKSAEKYLKAGGMTDKEISILKSRLAGY